MAGPDKPRESEPIDDVIDWLRAQKFSRMGTRRVSWEATGTKGSVSDQITVRERYVIEFDGDRKACAMCRTSERRSSTSD